MNLFKALALKKALWVVPVALVLLVLIDEFLEYGLFRTSLKGAITAGAFLYIFSDLHRAKSALRKEKREDMNDGDKEGLVTYTEDASEMDGDEQRYEESENDDFHNEMVTCGSNCVCASGKQGWIQGRYKVVFAVSVLLAGLGLFMIGLVQLEEARVAYVQRQYQDCIAEIPSGGGRITSRIARTECAEQYSPDSILFNR